MKTHVSLATRDLDASVRFYRALLNTEPAKHYDDYALFLTDDPGLELALVLRPQVGPSMEAHYGIAVDDPGFVDDAIGRLKSAGLPVDIETGETCCYATQNKVWATDPDGRRWEAYYVIAESEERESEDMTCCREHHDVDPACCAG